MHFKKCGTRISDIREFCKDCGAKVEGTNKTKTPSVAAKCICLECGAASRGYEGADVYQKEKKRPVRPVPIIICASTVAIVLVIVFCKLFFENRAAHDMYNLAYTAVYDTDMTYISPMTEQLVNSAYEQSQ